MATSFGETEIQDLLAQLRSEDRWRRWGAVHRLTVRRVDDARVVSALRFIASQDPDTNLRAEARSALPGSAHSTSQTTLDRQERKPTPAPTVDARALPVVGVAQNPAPVGGAEKKGGVQAGIV